MLNCDCSPIIGASSRSIWKGIIWFLAIPIASGSSNCAQQRFAVARGRRPNAYLPLEKGVTEADHSGGDRIAVAAGGRGPYNPAPLNVLRRSGVRFPIDLADFTLPPRRGHPGHAWRGKKARRDANLLSHSGQHCARHRDRVATDRFGFPDERAENGVLRALWVVEIAAVHNRADEDAVTGALGERVYRA